VQQKGLDGVLMTPVLSKREHTGPFSPVPGGSFALADVGASHRGCAGVPSVTLSPLPERRAASPCARGRSAGATVTIPPTRAGGVPMTPAAVGSTLSAGPATAAQVSDLARSTGVGLAGIRGEIATQRKKLVIMSSQLRAVTKRVGDIAVLADL